MVKQQAELQKYLLWKEYLLLQERKYGSRLLLRVSLKTKNIYDKEPVIKACKVTRDVLTDTKEIDREMSELLREIEVVTELTQKYVMIIHHRLKIRKHILKHTTTMLTAMKKQN